MIPQLIPSIDTSPIYFRHVLGRNMETRLSKSQCTLCNLHRSVTFSDVDVNVKYANGI